MRLYAPLFEDDNTLRPDAALGESAGSAKESTASTLKIVHSNIALENAAGYPVAEEDVRQLRDGGIMRMTKTLFAAIGEWLERSEHQERDNFFAAAENLADLEQRQRHFERTGVAHY